jgi:hypothetical protein
VPAQFKPEQSGNNNLGSLWILSVRDDYRMSDPARKASNSEKHRTRRKDQDN